jgi:bacteriocin biosynthesis cyclodehydratase domain-containing protein
MRPVLKPALRRLWRDATTVQLGLDPDRAVVLGGCDRSVAALLEALDGTRDRVQLLLEAARRGIDPALVDELLLALSRAGALDDAARPLGELALLQPVERDRLEPDRVGLSLRSGQPGAAVDVLTRRRRSHLAVIGTGRVGAPLAAHLATAGVGALTLVDPRPTRPADLAAGGLPPTAIGRPRAIAAGDAIRESSPATRVGDGATVPAACDLVVVTVPDRELTDLLVRDRLPHLFVGVGGATAVVGPLVLPAVTSCARCHDLIRADRDPAWPRLAAQLQAQPADGGEIAVAGIAAAIGAAAALEALATLQAPDAPDAAGRLTDATLELSPPDWRLRRRSWRPHPDCPCGAGGAADEELAGAASYAIFRSRADIGDPGRP